MSRLVFVRCVAWCCALLVTGSFSARADDDALELKQVVLYSAGLGAFQFEADLEGEQTLKLPFSASDVNDVLRTLTVHDPESKLKFVRVETPGAKPTEPLINIQSRLDLLVALRGEEVTLYFSDAEPMRGRLLSVENSLEALDEKMVERVRISLAGPSGIETCLLEDVTRFECLEEEAQVRITKALNGLNETVEEDVTAIELGFAAGPKRTIRLGYLHSMPVWKPSYTLTDEDLSLRVLVDNVSKQDWRDIDLTVVDGQPVSFAIDLRQIAWLQRERLELPIGLPGLPPLLAESTLDQRRSRDLIAAAGQGELGGYGDAYGDDYGMGGMGGGMGGMGGMAGDFGDSGGMPPGKLSPAQQAGRNPFGMETRLGLATQAKLALDSEGGGASFVMTFEDITLPADSASLLTSPTLEVSSDPVSVYLHNNAEASAFPYMAAKLTNRSQVLLPPGPVSIFSGASFLGEAMLPRLSPGRARLISFAIDGAVRVEPLADRSVQSVQTIRVDQKSKRILVRSKTVQSRSFKISNRAPELRTVEIETDFGTSGWKVKLADGDEKLGEQIRLETEVGPQQDLIRVTSREREQTDQLSFGSSSLAALESLLRHPHLDDETNKQIRQVIAWRSEYDTLRTQLQRAEDAVQNEAKEVDRLIRINATKTFTAETAAKFGRKLDEAEQRREELRAQTEVLRQQSYELQKQLYSPGDSQSRSTSQRGGLFENDDPFAN